MSRALVMVLLLALAPVARAARDFERDDTDDRLVCSTVAVSPTGPWTWSFWVWMDTDTNTLYAVSSGDDATNTSYFSVWVDTGAWPKHIRFEINTPATYRSINANPTVATGVWTHVAVIYTSATSRTMVSDGKWSLKTTNVENFSGMVQADRLAFGCLTRIAQVGEFDGAIAQFAQWNAALTQSEIEALAGWNGTNGLPSLAAHPFSIRPESLQVFLPFDGRNTGNEIDRIGGHVFTNTGTTIVDGPTFRQPGVQYSQAPALRPLWRRSPLYFNRKEEHHVLAA